MISFLSTLHGRGVSRRVGHQTGTGDFNSNIWHPISFLGISLWIFPRDNRHLLPRPKRLSLTWYTLPLIRIHQIILLSSDCKTWIVLIEPACVNLRSGRGNQNGGALPLKLKDLPILMIFDLMSNPSKMILAPKDIKPPSR